MNIIFTGGTTRSGCIYDYTGIWSRKCGRTSWKAIVRNSGVVCRPFGVVEDEMSENELLAVIAQHIESSITEALCRTRRIIG